MDWADLIDDVAVALAEQPLSGGAEPLGPARAGLAFAPSMLTAVAAAEPVKLWRRHQRLLAEGEPATDDSAAQLFDGPQELLAGGIIDVAGQATGHPGGRVAAVVAISALSTIRLRWMPDDAALAAVRDAADRFAEPRWAAALDAVSARTEELLGLLAAARGAHHRSWRQVRLGDQMLAEAVAAAVAGGAGSASGTQPDQWLFPFHVFCKVGMSAAWHAVDAIERWLGVEFLPAKGVARQASLAEFIIGEARPLPAGCPCKNDTDPHDAGYTPRGACRQIDHDIRRWQPGELKPGNERNRFAETLWGWLRRWLGGTAGGAAAGPDGQPRLWPNDVAGSVLARKWLSTQHGLGGPVLRYDRILPEFCLSCGQRPQIRSARTADGGKKIDRVCCPEPKLVYQSEFTNRGGKRLLKPKLGLVVSSPEGVSGYLSTEQLGELWVCHASGRYSRSGRYCPGPDCGDDPPGRHSAFQHGWVLAPLSAAWNDLRTTAKPADAQPGAAPDYQISEPDLRFLRQEMRRVQPAAQLILQTPEDVWAVAKNWSVDEVASFTELAGNRGAELIVQCKAIATCGTPHAEAGQRPGADDDEAAR